MDHKQDAPAAKQDLQKEMAKDFDKLAAKDDDATDVKKAGDTGLKDVKDVPPKDPKAARAALEAEVKKQHAEGLAAAMHPEFIPKLDERPYESFYFRRDGVGFQIRDATHHLDYPAYIAVSPMAFGIETAPGVPLPEPKEDEKKIATEVKTKE